MQQPRDLALTLGKYLSKEQPKKIFKPQELILWDEDSFGSWLKVFQVVFSLRKGGLPFSSHAILYFIDCWKFQQDIHFFISL